MIVSTPNLTELSSACGCCRITNDKTNKASSEIDTINPILMLRLIAIK